MFVFIISKCKGVIDVGFEVLVRYCKELIELDFSSCFMVDEWFNINCVSKLFVLF